MWNLMLSTIHGDPKANAHLHYTRANDLIPSINIHKSAQQMSISYGSKYRLLTRHMHLLPYKTTSAHELKEMDNIEGAEYF
jgi:hypothetical protein